jgi:LuxR family maltose regulon positive regulatory protein
MLAPRVATEREGRFTPVLRSRVLERIARAARYPIAVIAAPAGYGKTVALRQYLDSINGPVVRYDLRASESTLLGFIRGFAHAFAEFAPDLAKTVISAYESNHSSPTCAADLAQWMHAHIKDFDGLVAIDDLHVAQDEPRVDEFLSRLIDLTKQKTSWLLASRGVGALPVASWIAYGDMEFVIDERDLRMTLDEAQSVAHELAPGVDEAELKALLGATDAWPTALSFALRSSTNVGDLREAAATSRDLLYRYLAEQVYRSLEPRHIELLHFIAQLQEIDVEVLRCAGFERPEASLEELQTRISFIYRERIGVYRCHDLFRDFLNYQLRLKGREATYDLQLRVAAAFESAGHILPALEVYSKNLVERETLRLLRAHAFLLLEQSHSDAVAGALNALPEETLLSEAIALALLALREVRDGHFSRAEALLENAIKRQPDRALKAEISLHLASLIFNQFRDPTKLLEPIVEDAALPEEVRIRALSYVGPKYAANGRIEDAVAAKRRMLDYLRTSKPSSVAAQVLHRAGIIAITLNSPYSEVHEMFRSSTEMAKNEGAFITAAAALGGMSTAALLYLDDFASARRYSEQAVNLARKTGSRFARRTALLQLINVEMWRGDEETLDQLQTEIGGLIQGSLFVAYNRPALAMMAAWRGNFQEAYETFPSWEEDPSFDFDRCFNRAVHSLYALAAGMRGRALELVQAALDDLRNVRTPHLYAMVLTEMSRSICALSLALAGKVKIARRILAPKPAVNTNVAKSVRKFASAVCDESGDAAICKAELNVAMADLISADRRGMAMLLERVVIPLLPASSAIATITSAEREILRALAQGKTAKEIAAQTGRSVHTVRTLSQRVIQKLDCSGRQQAILVAQRRGLIEGPGHIDP